MRWITSISLWLLKKRKRWHFIDVKYYKKGTDKNSDERIEQGLWESLPPLIMKG